MEATKPNPRDDKTMEAFGWLLGTSCVFLGWALAWLVSVALDTCLEKMNLVGDVKFDDDGNLKSKETLQEEKKIMKAMGDDVIYQPDEYDPKILAAKNGLDIITVQELAEFYVDGEWDGKKALNAIVTKEGSFTRLLFKMKRSLEESEYCQIRLANSAFQKDQSKFLRLGMFTALALGIHNLPEGMATYTSYMEDPAFGVGMAFAIAVHNIPEGIAVAVPCYFGTGSWLKALSLCAISAIAEPIGACIAMGIKNHSDSELTDGIMFGFISGFMLRVAISELFFTAFRYDPTNVVANKSVCLGMGIMAFSLTIFEFV